MKLKEMEMTKLNLNLGLASILMPIGAIFAFLFGTITPLFYVLIVCISLDFITGFLKGIYLKKLRSRTMLQGGIRKASIFIVIILANMLDLVFFAAVPVAKTAAISYYIAMEGLSIVENMGEMDIPLPAFIKKVLVALKDKSDNATEKESMKDNN